MSPTESIIDIARRLSRDFVPELADFLGGARLHAQDLQTEVNALKATGLPMRFLVLGPPGIGKSMLAAYLVRLCEVDRFHITKVNGTSVRKETVEQWTREMHLRDMFGMYRVWQIEEVDRASRDAQVALLTLLDDLPDRNAVIATSNCKLEELEERFQSRFDVIQPAPPTTDELCAFLRRYPLTEPEARQIAAFACGCVRQALNDAKAALRATHMTAPVALAA